MPGEFVVEPDTCTTKPPGCWLFSSVLLFPPVEGISNDMTSLLLTLLALLLLAASAAAACCYLISSFWIIRSMCSGLYFVISAMLLFPERMKRLRVR